MTRAELIARAIQAVANDDTGDIGIAEIEALLAERRELLARQVPEWLPIDSAPMETWVLGYQNGKIGNARRADRDDGEVWQFAGSTAHVEFFPEVKPTHWMPLPAPPTPTIAGFRVREDNTVPAGEVHKTDASGKVLGKVVNVTPTLADRYSKPDTGPSSDGFPYG